MKPLAWGLIGGGEGSQIGPAHRLGARADGYFVLVAGALDADPVRGRAFASAQGIAADRAYPDWQAMLAGERQREDRLDLITVATPNNTHFAITRALLKAGFHVLCEKPMTMDVDEAQELVRIALADGRICAVNYCYSAYPVVRHMKVMVESGELGRIRLVVVNFSHGHHADASQADNPRLRWRYDPEHAGVSGQFADCGIHALHLAGFVTGDAPRILSADFVRCVPARALEDDAMLNLRSEGGAVWRLWTSSVALGRQHGLDIQVFGEKGGLKWRSEAPNQALWTPLRGRTQIIEKGEPGISDAATMLSRAPAGHPEGFMLAVANIYADIAAAIRASQQGVVGPDRCNRFLPSAEDGLQTAAALVAAVRSAQAQGKWVEV